MGKRRPAHPDPPQIRTLHGSFADEELDLHGMSGDEAERRVRLFIDRRARTEPGGVVRVITGKGRGSPGAPVLRQRLLDLLNGELRRYVDDWAGEPGGGSFLVRVKDVGG